MAACKRLDESVKGLLERLAGIATVPGGEQGGSPGQASELFDTLTLQPELQEMVDLAEEYSGDEALSTAVEEVLDGFAFRNDLMPPETISATCVEELLNIADYCSKSGAKISMRLQRRLQSSSAGRAEKRAMQGELDFQRRQATKLSYALEEQYAELDTVSAKIAVLISEAVSASLTEEAKLEGKSVLAEAMQKHKDSRREAAAWMLVMDTLMDWATWSHASVAHKVKVLKMEPIRQTLVRLHTDAYHALATMCEQANRTCPGTVPLTEVTVHLDELHQGLRLGCEEQDHLDFSPGEKERV